MMDKLTQRACEIVTTLEKKRQNGTLNIIDVVQTKPDPRHRHLFASPVINSHLRSEGKRLVIPRIIHQVWFTDHKSAPLTNISEWKQYAAELGYEYHFWSEANMKEFATIMSEENFKLLQELLRTPGFVVHAVNLVQFEVLRHFGGVYVHSSIIPKNGESGHRDIKDFIAMDSAGVVVLPEQRPRYMGYALTASTSLMLAAPQHPIFVRACSGIATNYRQGMKSEFPCSAAELTGSSFFTGCLQGAFTVWDPVAFTTYFQFI